MINEKNMWGKAAVIFAFLTVVWTMANLALAEDQTPKDMTSSPGETNSSLSPPDNPETVKDALTQERERIKQRIDMIRLWSLITELGLDGEKAKVFFPLMYDYQRRKNLLIKKVYNLKMRLAAALSNKDASPEEVQKLLDEYCDLTSQQTRLSQEELRKLSEILTPRQQAQYILFGDRFNRELNFIIRQAMSDNDRKPDRTKDGKSAPAVAR
jgi:hypothetical protein